MSDTTARITWDRKLAVGVNGWAGHINGKHLFSIGYSMKRGEGHVLRTTLPWKIKEQFSTGDPEQLKLVAERVLAAFLAKIGAAFVEQDEENS
jgi:hypothetical protein